MNHKLWNSFGDFRTRQYLLFLVVFVALIATFVSWSVSSPLGSAPDDAYHSSQIWCAANASDQCEIISQEGETLTVRVPYISPNCHWNPIFQNASCISQSESISEQVASFGRSDYPNGMYKVLNLFVSENPNQSVLSMRIFNGFLAASIILSALILAPRKLRFALVVSWIPVLNPHGFFFISSINPTGWSFLSIATNWIFLYLLLQNIHTTRQNIMRFSTVSGMYLLTLLIGLLSRWDSRVFLAVTSLAVFLIANHEFKWVKVRHIAITAVASVGFLIVLMERSYRIRSAFSLNPIRNSSGFETFQYLIYLLVHLIEFPIGVFGVDTAWGGLGGLFPSTPPVVGYIGLSIALGSLVVAFIKPNRLQVFSASFIALAILGAVYQQQNIGRYLVGDMVAPRYIMGMVAVLLGIATLTSRDSDKFFLKKHFRIGGTVLLSIAHSVALYSNMDRFITFGLGTTGTFKGFGQEGRWWWDTSISPYFVWGLGSLAFGVFLTAVWQVCLPEVSDSNN
jgi:hypothetical protein